MNCRKCATPYPVSQGRVPFRARCARCDTPLHVCMQCGHYDPGAYNGCRESGAERVTDKERENRCEYFRPGSSNPKDEPPGDDAKKAFDDLFG